MEKIYRNKLAIFLFIAPAAILFTVVLLVPILYAIYISFCDFNGIAKPVFTGIQNYKTLFVDDPIMKTALKNSLFFTVFSVVTQQILGLFIAVLLSNVRKGKNIFKNVYYLPCILSSAAVGLMFLFLFNPRMGINQILDTIGIQGPNWLFETKGFIPLPMWAIGIVATWQYFGSTMMLYMAGIAGIPSTFYEAAYMDGATKFKAFRHITFPLIRPMVKTTISLTCIGSLKFFDLIYSMTNAGPNHKTEVLATHLYTQAFRYFRYGYASTISIILLILCLFITFVTNKSIKVEDYEM